MLQVVVKLIGVILVLVGLILIYDARMITKKFFGFGDQNDGAQGLKILGFIVSMVGGLIVYFV